MRRIVMAGLLAALAGPAAADWVRLTTDDQIAAALAGRTVIYDAYTRQSFDPAGGTVHVTERMATGRWEARDGRLCTNWPPSAAWRCVTLEMQGGEIRFISDTGLVSRGAYAE